MGTISQMKRFTLCNQRYRPRCGQRLSGRATHCSLKSSIGGSKRRARRVSAFRDARGDRHSTHSAHSKWAHAVPMFSCRAFRHHSYTPGRQEKFQKRADVTWSICVKSSMCYSSVDSHPGMGTLNNPRKRILYRWCSGSWVSSLL